PEPYDEEEYCKDVQEKIAVGEAFLKKEHCNPPLFRKACSPNLPHYDSLNRYFLNRVPAILPTINSLVKSSRPPTHHAHADCSAVVATQTATAFGDLTNASC